MGILSPAFKGTGTDIGHGRFLLFLQYIIKEKVCLLSFYKETVVVIEGIDDNMLQLRADATICISLPLIKDFTIPVQEEIRQKALADADAIRLTKEAEAEGTRKLLMAEAEGKRASLLAEAEALQQKELAPALAFEKMVSVAGDPSLAVQWKTVDHLEGIAGAQAEALSRVTLGNVTVYGDSSTGGQFIKDLMANVTPAIDMISSGMKEPLKNLFGKKSEFPEIENK